MNMYTYQRVLNSYSRSFWKGFIVKMLSDDIELYEQVSDELWAKDAKRSSR